MKIQYAQEELGNGLFSELGTSNLCPQQPWEEQLSRLWLFSSKAPPSPHGAGRGVRAAWAVGPCPGAGFCSRMELPSWERALCLPEEQGARISALLN